MDATQPPLVHVADDSHDRSYFVLTPQIVWALCQDPYQFTLWTVVKMIAGEAGECILETGDLAAAAMMSAGKCHQARRALMALRLLHGDLRRDPGYPRKVWHLSIPDLWPANVQWRLAHPMLKDRIAAKHAQRRSIHLVKGARLHSPGELSPSPGETKKIHDLIHQEERAWTIWIAAQNELAMQMTRSTYNTWIKPLAPASIDDARARLVCPTPYVQEWNANRLDIVIRRTLAGLVGADPAEYQVEYTLAEPQPALASARAGPIRR